MKHKKLILLPMVLGVLGALGYILFNPALWSARQSIVVRDLSVGVTADATGRFDSLDILKFVQQTILDTTTSQNVIEELLKDVGPDKITAAKLRRKGKEDSWPTLEDIEDFRDRINISPPNGAELGMTESLYISVKDRDQKRAAEFARKLALLVQDRFGKLQVMKAEGMKIELEQATKISEDQLAEANSELKAFEEKVGVDLSDLRSLNNPIGGASGLHSQIATIETELRTGEQKKASLKNQLVELEKTLKDPENLLATSEELLTAQPALKRLKDGLVDARLKKATVLGTYKSTHPRAQVAIQEVENAKTQLRDELTVAISGLKSQIQVLEQTEVKLKADFNDKSDRINRLSSLRVEYQRLNENVRQAHEYNAKAKKKYSDANAVSKSSKESSAISLVNETVLSARPEGLSKKVLVGMGAIAGLGFGIGLFMIFTSPGVQPQEQAERRQTGDVDSPRVRNVSSLIQRLEEAEEGLASRT